MVELEGDLPTYVPEPVAIPRRKPHWPALLGFVLLTCLFTFPAVIRLGSHILGMDDAQYFVWELWWFHRAVFELHTDPLHTAMLFFPTPSVPLIWSTPVNLLPGMLITGLVGPVAAYNMLVMTGLVLSGYGAYRLAHRFVGRRDAAFLAGMIFALAPAHMAQVTSGHLGVMTIQWVPFSVLALLRLHDRPSWARAGLFALMLALVLASDLYVAIYFLGTLALAGAIACFRNRPSKAFLGRLAVGAATAVLAVVPFHLPTWRNLRGAVATVSQGQTVDRFGQDVLQLLMPAPWHPVMGHWAWTLNSHITNRDSWGTLGVTALVLAAIGLWKRRDAVTRFWAWASGLAIVGSLGTTLHVAGPTSIPLPYALFTHMPVLKNLRVPGRLAEVTALGLAMLAAAGAAWYMARHPARGRLAFGLLAGAIAFECLIHAPFPTTSAAVPAFYRSLPQNPNAGAILELPNGFDDWGGPTHRWMYYQTVHHKPLVVGHTHRIPDGALDFVHRTPLVSALAYESGEGLPAYITPKVAAEGARRMAEAGITHVVVHSIPGVWTGSRYQRLLGDLTTLFGAPVYQQADMAVFLTPPPHVGRSHGR